MTWPLLLIVVGSLLKVSFQMTWARDSPHGLYEVISSVGIVVYAFGWQPVGAIIWALASAICFLNLVLLGSSPFSNHSGMDPQYEDEAFVDKAIERLRAKMLERAAKDDIFRSVMVAKGPKNLLDELRDKPIPEARGSGNDSSSTAIA